MIDARIPLGIQPVQLEGPLDQAQKGMSLRALMTQMKAQEADLADRPARNALAMRKAQMEEQKMGLDLDNAKLEQIGKASGVLGQFASAVKAAGYDQNAWQQGKQFLAANGAPEQVLAALPDQVDPKTVDGLITRAMTVADAIKRGNLAELYAEEQPQGQQQAPQQQVQDEPIVRPYTPNPDAPPLNTAIRIGDHSDKGGTGPAADDWGIPPQAEMRQPDDDTKKPPSLQDDLRAQAAAKRKKADEIRRTFRTQEAFDEAKRLEEEAGRLEDDAWKMREQTKYQERKRPDATGTKYIHESSTDGGKTWQRLPDSGAVDVRAASGGTDIKFGDSALGLGKAATTKVEEGILDATARKARLARVEQSYKPEFLEIGNRLSNSWNALKEKAGIGVSESDKKQLAEFTQWKQGALDNLNQYIKEITGAALSEPEAKRIMGALPNPGQNWYDGDSPTQFKAGLDRAVRDLKAAEARFVYIKRNGLSTQDVPLERMPQIMDQRGQELETVAKQRYPNMSDDEIRKTVRRTLAQEFGLVAD